MTMDDALRLLLAVADDMGRVFGHTEIGLWPNGALESFRAMGLIREAQTGLTARCPDCAEAHIEPVVVVEEPGCSVRYFIRCPESLRVEVTLEMCRGWEVDPEGLALAIAVALALTGAPKPIVLDRLWRLGRIPWEGKTREVLLARRLGDDDAGAVAAHVGVGGRAIVLVPHHVPDELTWPGRTPAVVALSRVATLDGEAVVIDGVALAEIVVEADQAAEAAGIVAIDKVGRKLVRRQVKAEIKTILADDALVAAYKEHGSFRKAAEALTEQTGSKISKDKVRRAVDRHGGADAIIPKEDSASVSRRVASHPRDRAKKFLERR